MSRSNNFYFNMNFQVASGDLKGIAMQNEKALTKDRLRVSKVSWKYRIPTIHNFAVIYPQNLLFS